MRLELEGKEGKEETKKLVGERRTTLPGVAASSASRFLSRRELLVSEPRHVNPARVKAVRELKRTGKNGHNNI